MSSLRVRRRRVGGSLPVVAAALLLATPSVAYAVWNDNEFDHATLRTLDCEQAEGLLQTRGAGRLLSGALLGLDLDTLAAVNGVTATNDGERSVADPSSSLDGGDQDSYLNPLNVSVLDTVDLDLTGVTASLGDLLNLSTQTGVVAQYGRAVSDGTSAGASGLVTDTGVIDLGSADSVPGVASIDLSTLLDASLGDALGDTLSNVTDLDLDVGAVAGRAFLDGCAEKWGAAITDAVTRQYLVAGLDLTIDSPLVGTLVTTVSDAVSTLQNAVEAVSGNQGVLNSIVGGVVGLVDVLPLAEASASVTATIDMSALTDPEDGLLHASLSDDDGVVTVDLDNGTVRVDLAALLARAYGDEFSNGLNGLPPNTELLISDEVITTLTTTLAGVLTDWVDQVNAALQAARNAVAVSADITVSAVPLLVRIDVLDIHVPEPPAETATLGDLLAGNVHAQVELLGSIPAPLVETLVNGVGLIVGSAVDAALPTVSALTSGLVETAVNPLVSMVGNLFGALFVPQDDKPAVLSLGVNAQNDPGTATCLDIGIGCVPPPDWASLPDGRHDVAALRIGVLDALNSVVTLYLARGSVGVTCVGVLDDPDCAGY